MTLDYTKLVAEIKKEQKAEAAARNGGSGRSDGGRITKKAAVAAAATAAKAAARAALETDPSVASLQALCMAVALEATGETRCFRLYQRALEALPVVSKELTLDHDLENWLALRQPSSFIMAFDAVTSLVRCRGTEEDAKGFWAPVGMEPPEPKYRL